MCSGAWFERRQRQSAALASRASPAPSTAGDTHGVVWCVCSATGVHNWGCRGRSSMGPGMGRWALSKNGSAFCRRFSSRGGCGKFGARTQRGGVAGHHHHPNGCGLPQLALWQCELQCTQMQVDTITGVCPGTVQPERDAAGPHAGRGSKVAAASCWFRQGRVRGHSLHVHIPCAHAHSSCPLLLLPSPS